MIQTILGKKIDQSQKFLEDGTRIPVTMIWAGENYVVQTMPKRVKLGFDTKKHITKSIAGILKKAGIDKNLRFFKEAITDDADSLKSGSVIPIGEVLKPGDRVTVMGVSKGKGFQGGVKRHHFKGGPRTHGQSDRERAPGSIGQTTTPGRVYKGKRMAARMGSDQVTIKNLEIMDITGDVLTVRGLVPGGRNSLLVITKIGESEKFVPIYQEKKEEEIKEPENVKEEVAQAAKTEDSAEEPKKTKEEQEEVTNAS